MKKRGKDPVVLGRGMDALFGDPVTPDRSGRERSAPGMAILAVAAVVVFLGGAATEHLLRNLSVGPPTVHAAGDDGGSSDRSGPAATGTNVTPSPVLPPPPAPAPETPGADPVGHRQAPPPDPGKYHGEAVRDALHHHFPLTPEDIDLMKTMVRKTQQAVHGPPPVGRAVSVSVSLDPGARFPEIHLVPGIATTITVVDATGAPWPIVDVIVGNEKAFPVKKLSMSNGVVVEPKNNVGWTSLALSLEGRGTPAVLKLVDSDRVSDTRVTARIEARGPNAATPVFQEPKPVVSARILAFLDGIPPSTARALSVRGTKDMEAWSDGGRLYVRTHMDVLAPAWLETVSGPNGMKLYVFSKVAVITAAGDDGEMKTIELEEPDGRAG